MWHLVHAPLTTHPPTVDPLCRLETENSNDQRLSASSLRKLDERVVSCQSDLAGLGSLLNQLQVMQHRARALRAAPAAPGAQRDG